MQLSPNPFRKVRRRYGEMAAEWSVRIVASASALTIGLIFLFVFREAAGIFTRETEAKPAQTAAPAAGDRPEVYNPEPDEVSALPTGATADEPEAYNPDAGEPPAEQANTAIDNAPEAYNPDPDDTPVSPAGNAVTLPPSPKSIWENLAVEHWQPVSEQPKFGILPLIVGTAKTTLTAIAVSAPLGILAAVYVAFFARRRVREIVKPFIEILAGFPSVVIGFFCLMTVGGIMQDLFGFDYRLNSIVGGIGLAITVVPVIFTITEDALSSVPKSYREASLALGATEWETAFRVMLPAALPGVIAAVLLGVGRAFGETMIALMATGNAPLATLNLADPARTFAATIGAEMGEVIWGSTHYSVLFFLGVLLFTVSFCINLVTEVFVRQRLARKFQGS